MAPVQDVVEALRPHHPHDLQRAVEHGSVEHSIANLRTFPWVRARAAAGELSLHGAWFDIAVGEVHTYDDEGSDGWLIAPILPAMP